jgi:hypothetical protein
MLQIGDNFVILAIERNEEWVNYMPYNVNKGVSMIQCTHLLSKLEVRKVSKVITCKNSFTLNFL